MGDQAQVGSSNIIQITVFEFGAPMVLGDSNILFNGISLGQTTMGNGNRINAGVTVQSVEMVDNNNIFSGASVTNATMGSKNTIEEGITVTYSTLGGSLAKNRLYSDADTFLIRQFQLALFRGHNQKRHVGQRQRHFKWDDSTGKRARKLQPYE